MRIKIKTVIFGVATLLLGLSPSARADSFQYDFTAPSDYSQPINIVFTITAPTLPTFGYVTSFTVSEPPDFTVTQFGWNTANDCFGSSFTLQPFSCAGFLAITGFGTTTVEDIHAFPIGSFLTPGSYTGFGATMTITDLSGVPEPSSFLLLGFGLLGITSFGALIRRHA